MITVTFPYPKYHLFLLFANIGATLIKDHKPFPIEHATKSTVKLILMNWSCFVLPSYYSFVLQP